MKCCLGGRLVGSIDRPRSRKFARSGVGKMVSVEVGGLLLLLSRLRFLCDGGAGVFFDCR